MTPCFGTKRHGGYELAEGFGNHRADQTWRCISFRLGFQALDEGPNLVVLFDEVDELVGRGGLKAKPIPTLLSPRPGPGAPRRALALDARNGEPEVAAPVTGRFSLDLATQGRDGLLDDGEPQPAPLLR